MSSNSLLRVMTDEKFLIKLFFSLDDRHSIVSHRFHVIPYHLLTYNLLNVYLISWRKRHIMFEADGSDQLVLIHIVWESGSTKDRDLLLALFIKNNNNYIFYFFPSTPTLLVLFKDKISKLNFRPCWRV